MPNHQNGPWVSVLMGSTSDYETLKPAIALLDELEVPREARIVSAHRTPHFMEEFAGSAEQRGIQVIIAAADAAAHQPGMVAAHTLVLVLGVPVSATHLRGIDSLLSIVQMPKGVPVDKLGIGEPGALNAAFLAAEIIALHQPELRARLRAYRDRARDQVLLQELK